MAKRLYLLVVMVFLTGPYLVEACTAEFISTVSAEMKSDSTMGSVFQMVRGVVTEVGGIHEEQNWTETGIDAATATIFAEAIYLGNAFIYDESGNKIMDTELGHYLYDLPQLSQALSVPQKVRDLLSAVTYFNNAVGGHTLSTDGDTVEQHAIFHANEFPRSP